MEVSYRHLEFQRLVRAREEYLGVSSIFLYTLVSIRDNVREQEIS